VGLARNARYTLCGTPAGPPCKPDVYAGAGFYQPAAVLQGHVRLAHHQLRAGWFRGRAEDSQVVADPVGGNQQGSAVNRAATAQTFAGTRRWYEWPDGRSHTVRCGQHAHIGARVLARRGHPGAAQGRGRGEFSRSVETEALTTKANAWETLTFDFANPAPRHSSR